MATCLSCRAWAILSYTVCGSLIQRPLSFRKPRVLTVSPCPVQSTEIDGFQEGPPAKSSYCTVSGVRWCCMHALDRVRCQLGDIACSHKSLARAGYVCSSGPLRRVHKLRGTSACSYADSCRGFQDLPAAWGGPPGPLLKRVKKRLCLVLV